MGKRKIPFKTNLDQPVGKVPDTPSKRPPHTHSTKGGIWIRKKNRPIRAKVVNKKKERAVLLKWILKWVIAIPVSAYALVWLFILMRDLFLF